MVCSKDAAVIKTRMTNMLGVLSPGNIDITLHAGWVRPQFMPVSHGKYHGIERLNVHPVCAVKSRYAARFPQSLPRESMEWRVQFAECLDEGPASGKKKKRLVV